jgi:hypothetical protein
MAGEDWSSVFLQALQNSMAEAKASQRWNQELAFKKDQFKQEVENFNRTMGLNEKQFAEAQNLNRAAFAKDFSVVNPEEWSKYASYYGGTVSNPFDSNDTLRYVPRVALNQRSHDEEIAKQRAFEFSKYFVPYNETAVNSFTYGPAKQLAQVQVNPNYLFGDKDKLFLDNNVPVGNYTLLEALKNATAIESDYSKFQQAQAAEREWHNLQAALERQKIAQENYWRQKQYETLQHQNSGYYRVRDNNGDTYYTYLTPDERNNMSSLGHIITPATPEEAANNMTWRKIVGGGGEEKGYIDNINNLKTSSELLDAWNKLLERGVNPYYVAPLYRAFLNKLYDAQIQEYYGPHVSKFFKPNFGAINKARENNKFSSAYYDLEGLIYNTPRTGINSHLVLQPQR